MIEIAMMAMEDIDHRHRLRITGINTEGNRTILRGLK